MKIIGKIFAVIFCIIYSFILTGLMTLAFASNIVSSNYYANVFENVDLSTIKVSDLNGLFDEAEFDENATLEDVIIEVFNEGDVDETKVKAFINDKKVRKAIGKVIGNVFSYAMGGEKPEITREEIVDFFDNQVVIDVTGKPTEENIDYVYDQINKIIEELEDGINDGPTERNSNVVKFPR